MGSNWENIAIGELITLQRGHDLPSQNRKEGNIPIMGSSGLTGFHNKAKTQGPGVVVGRSGNSMGVVSYTETDYWPLNTCLYITDFKGNDVRYVYYILQQVNFDQFNSGSAQKSLNRNAVYPFKIYSTTDKVEQRKIGKLLSQFEEKVDLNTQTNQTLEQMAQTLFKSWFVDFDPVFDNLLAKADFKLENLDSTLPEELVKKAKIRLLALNGLTDAVQTKTSLKALAQGLSPESPEILTQHATTHVHFPDEFEHNEQLGWIPKGWKIKPFKSVIDKYIDNRGKTPPLVENGIPLIEVKHIPEKSNFPSFNSEKQFSSETYNTWFRAHVQKKDILISTVGTIGRTSFVKDINLGIAQNVLGLRFGKSVMPEYMFYYIKSHRFQHDMDARLVTTVQASIKRKDLDTINILVPSKLAQSNFSKIIDASLAKQFSKVSESEQLTKLRDTLLPKLISGELQIPDVKSES